MSLGLVEPWTSCWQRCPGVSSIFCFENIQTAWVYFQWYMYFWWIFKNNRHFSTFRTDGLNYYNRSMSSDLGQLSASFGLSSSSRQLTLIRASLKDYLYVKFVYVWPNFWDRFCLYTLLYIRRKYVIITEIVPRTISSITVLTPNKSIPAYIFGPLITTKWARNFWRAVFGVKNSYFLVKTMQKVFQKLFERSQVHFWSRV